MINTQLNIFVMILIGWMLAKKGILDPSFTNRLNGLVMNLLLPANILHSFQMDVTFQTLVNTGTILLLSCGIQILMIILSKFLWKRVKNPDQRVSLEYATAANNAGTLGMVISQAAFGSRGVLYSAVYMIPVRIVMWSYGLALYAGKNEGENRSLTSLIFHPCLCAVYLGIALMLFQWAGWQLPEFVQMSLNGLAGCSTPMILMVIGSILSQVPINQLKDRTVLGYSAVRLIVLPCLIYFVLKVCQISALPLGLCVLETGMPAPVTMGLLASKYDCEPAFASSLIFLSTLASMLTLPMWTWILTA